MVDVVRFGSRYCPQHDGCLSLLRAIEAEADARRFRKPWARTIFITRRLRQEGLSVRTLTDVRARRVRFRSGRRVAR